MNYLRTEMTDEDLMNSYIEGSQKSFEILTLRWSDKLHFFVGKRINRAEMAEEILQEIFLNVCRGKKTWAGGEYKFSTWIYTIAKNVIISSGRTKRAKNEVLWIEDKSEEEEEEIKRDPLTNLWLNKAIDSLPDHLSEAFRLTYIQGMDHREAAEIAKISPDNMRARASRARSALKEMVE